MRTSLRLTAALLACLAVPALAQTPSTGSSSSNRNTPPPPASTMAPPTTTTAPTTTTSPSGSNRSSATSPSTTATTPSTTAAPTRPGTATSTPSTTTAPSASTTSTPSGRTTGTAAGAGAGTAAGTGAARATATSGKIDINSATEQQLDTLPGVGPARAKGIISGRPWDDLNDLVKKGVLTQNVLDGVKARLALANINTSSAADLAKTLPGIGPVHSRAIVNGRPYGQPQDLVTKGVLTQNAFDKIKDLIAF